VLVQDVALDLLIRIDAPSTPQHFIDELHGLAVGCHHPHPPACSPGPRDSAICPLDATLLLVDCWLQDGSGASFETLLRIHFIGELTQVHPP
jgi:hypothetical protein